MGRFALPTKETAHLSRRQFGSRDATKRKCRARSRARNLAHRSMAWNPRSLRPNLSSPANSGGGDVGAFFWRAGSAARRPRSLRQPAKVRPPLTLRTWAVT
jgi:hypothetical protein